MTPKDPNTAFIIELVGGIFGLLGLGYFYVGRTNDGVLRLALWLLYDIVAFCAITALLAIVVGFVCIPIQLIIQVGVPLWSAFMLKKQLLGGGSISSPSVLTSSGGVQFPLPLSSQPVEQMPYAPVTSEPVALPNPPSSAYIIPGADSSFACSSCGGNVTNDATSCQHCKAPFIQRPPSYGPPPTYQ